MKNGSSGLDLLTNYSKKKPRYARDEIDKVVYYWTASEFNNSSGYYRKLTRRASIEKGNELKFYRYPVRCIKDDVRLQ